MLENKIRALAGLDRSFQTIGLYKQLVMFSIAAPWIYPLNTQQVRTGEENCLDQTEDEIEMERTDHMHAWSQLAFLHKWWVLLA